MENKKWDDKVMSKPKKIANIYSGAEHSGGIETYLELFIDNYDKNNVDLTIISLGESSLAGKLQSANCKLQIFSGARINLITVFSIARYLKTNNFNLVVSQGTVANAYARAASLLSRVPNLVTVHSDPYYDYPNFVARVIYGAIDRFTRFQTKKYITVSEYLKQKLVKSGVSEKKISVIHNGVKDPGLDSRLRGNDVVSGVVIGSIGRLHKVKNYDCLICAVSQLPSTSYKLLIAGEGTERENLGKLITELGVDNNVKLLGHLDNVSELLGQIDLYVQPSLSEGFGITVIEAMIAGKPVIVSPYGALQELVEDGKTGIVLNDASAESITNAIKELTSDRDMANKLAISGQKYAIENFNVEKWVRATEDAYLEAAE